MGQYHLGIYTKANIKNQVLTLKYVYRHFKEAIKYQKLPNGYSNYGTVNGLLNQEFLVSVYLKLLSSMCVCVCVSAPEAINNWWHDMDPIWLVKQVLQLLYFSYGYNINLN